MHWNIVATQNDEAWFDDYIRHIISHEPPALPAHDQRIGRVDGHWHQVSAGVAYITADGGTADDRRLVEAIVEEQLRPHGFKRAVVSMTYDRSDLRKTAEWGDIESKAKRLVQTGGVQLLRNGYNSVISQVQGDHGTYKCEISRSDPSSRAITGSHCDCDWGGFQNTPRTRQWKRFQDRPCAHILATFWQAQATPLDEDRAPGDSGGQGQMSIPGMGDLGPMQAPGSMPMMQNNPFQTPSWGAGGGPTPMAQPSEMQTPSGIQAPTPESLLPQFPMDPSLQPQVNPASTPGGRPGPTPTNPAQYPGGTFSSWHPDTMLRMAAQEYRNGDLVQLRHDDVNGTLVGRSEEHGAGSSTNLKGGQVGEVLGTHPSTGLVNVLYMGKPYDTNSYFEPFGATAWHWPSSLILRNDLTPPGPAIRRR